MQLSVSASLCPTAELSGFANPLINDFMQLNILPLDLTITDRPVRLKVMLDGQVINAYSKTVLRGVNELNINGGENLMLTGQDLAPYFEFQNIANISQSVYTSMLPQGHYYLKFELIDQISNQKISNTATTLLFIHINEPPDWMLPENGHAISLDIPINIGFQWLPRHTTFSNVEYLFEMVEIMDGSDANTAFMTHQPFYSETFYNTMFVYGMDKPALLPGHKYAYRVKAIATKNGEPVALFKNNGYSEVRWMEYSEACPPATNLYIDNLQPSQFDVVWEGDFNHEGYTVYYRPSGSFVDPLWEETHGTRASIRGVGPERSYQVWVESDCGYGMTSKSKAIDVQTPSIGDYEVKGCGIPVASSPLESSAGLMQLSTNDVFLAYDFPVTVEEATGGNGTFTGTGYIQIPFLGGGQPRIKVKFNNIVINSAYRMVYGAVKTTYDSSWGSVTSLNEFFEGGEEVGNILSGNTDPEVTIETGEIIIDNEGNPTGIEVDTASNQISITTQNENGQQSTETVNGNLHNEGDGIVTIIDTEGNLFVVDTDTGQVNHIGKLTEDATKILASFDPYTVHNDLGIVDFENNCECQWAFDQPNPAYAKSLLLYQNEYETIDHYEGDSVYRPCQKLIGAGSTGKVTAKLTEGTIDIKNLVFITQEGMILEPEQEGNNLNLELPAACDGDGYKLYALHKEAGSYQQVGQLKVVSYSKKTPEVVLVPVGMAKKDIDLEITKNELKEIFAEVNIELDLTVAEPFTENSWDANQNGLPDVSGDTWFKEYSEEQQELIKSYKEYLTAKGNYTEDDQTAYVFVFGGTPQGADGMYRGGDMPIKHQWGFLFGGMDTRTLAHELGHGIFTLRHSFDKDYGLDPQTTDNLMDYNEGNQFIKYQWDVMHDPSELGAPWQRDAEGAAAEKEPEDSDYIYFTSDKDAWFRKKESPYKAIKPTTETPGLAIGTQIALLKVVKDGKGNDVAKFKIKGQTEIFYTTLTNLSKIEKFPNDVKYKLALDYESLKLPYGSHKAKKTYKKHTTFDAIAKCGDFVKVKGEGDDIEGHWISEGAAVVGTPDYPVTVDQIDDVFKNTTKDILKEVVDLVNKYSSDFDIDSKERMAHFLAQIGHETESFKKLIEGCYYSKANAQLKSFSRYLSNETSDFALTTGSDVKTTLVQMQNPNLLDALSEQQVWYLQDDDLYKIANDTVNKKYSYDTLYNNADGINTIYVANKAPNCPIFDYVYCCGKADLGNGDVSSKDGSRFRGRGYIHLTGRYNYNKYFYIPWKKEYLTETRTLNELVDLLITDKDLAMKAAMIYWKNKGINEIADNPKKLGDAEINKKVTLKINNGGAGLDERKTFFSKLKNKL